MSRNYYSEINLHIVWHTKGNLLQVTAEVEIVAHQQIKQKVINTTGAFVHAIGGVADHVHVAVSIAPTVDISALVGQMKGVSSHEVNQKLGVTRKLLEWQTGYGVVSFGTKDLDWVIDYIRRQKEHHKSGNVFDRLERIEPKEEKK